MPNKDIVFLLRRLKLITIGCGIFFATPCFDRVEAMETELSVSPVAVSDSASKSSGNEKETESESLNQSKLITSSIDQGEKSGDSTNGDSGDSTNGDTDDQSEAISLLSDRVGVLERWSRPSMNLEGFLQFDAGWFTQDEVSTEQLGDIEDNRNFRRVRLQTGGTVKDSIRYKMQLDFGISGRPSLLDAYAEYVGTGKLGSLRVGHYRMPFGMDELTKVTELTFVERPLMFGMGPFREFGAGLQNTVADDSATWAASVFSTGTDGLGNSVGDGGFGTAERVTGILFEVPSEEALVHVGFGHCYVNQREDQFRIRSIPEYGGAFATPGTVPVFLDTGLVAAESTNFFNGELAATWKSFHMQSELRYALVDQVNRGTTTLPSFYVQCGYVLTGEHRPYSRKPAILRQVTPSRPFGTDGGIGAVELATRFSMMDLNRGGMSGGELDQMSFIINWYLNDAAKVQLMYSHADLERTLEGRGQTDIFVSRFQVLF